MSESEKETETFTDEQKGIMNKAHEKKLPDMEIWSMPYKCRKEFKDFARREFMGHYGFAFKEVWDCYIGGIEMLGVQVSNEVRELNARIVALEEQLKVSNKTKESEPKKVTKTMCDGTQVEVD
ncbi:hypothetical protein M0R04_11225 [Candidatus Dojkabacteria bacterium]|jgi:hypothetical protein|nr:hypothetical protein [Candidatus Dojkabacteria bacterium]